MKPWDKEFLYCLTPMSDPDYWNRVRESVNKLSTNSLTLGAQTALANSNEHNSPHKKRQEWRAIYLLMATELAARKLAAE